MNEPGSGVKVTTMFVLPSVNKLGTDMMEMEVGTGRSSPVADDVHELPIEDGPRKSFVTSFTSNVSRQTLPTPYPLSLEELVFVWVDGTLQFPESRQCNSFNFCGLVC